MTNETIDAVEVVEQEKPTASFQIDWLTVLIAVLLSALVSVSVLAIYDRVVAPKIITIRIDEIIASHIKQIASSNLTDQEKQAMSDQWSKALDKAIKTIQGNKNVVLTQNAVVTGGLDYTQTVNYLINQNMDYTAANSALAAAMSRPQPQTQNAPINNNPIPNSTPVQVPPSPEPLQGQAGAAQ